MNSGLVGRVRSIQTVISRATPTPLLVRCGVFLSALVALAVALPWALTTGWMLLVPLVVALLPAIAPRRGGVMVAVLVAVAGWLVTTTGYGERIALWRLLTLAAALYLTHSLGALAALLPYDAVVGADVVARWALRALAVVLASAVLAVILLSVARRSGEGTLPAAALGGLAIAVVVAVMLSWLLHRDQR